MPTLSFEELSQAEREELALCGITDAEQLQRCTAEGLMHDLARLQSFFPKHEPALSEARVKALCPAEAEQEEKEAISSDFIPETTGGMPSVQFKNKKNLREEIMAEREAAEQARRSRVRGSKLSASEKLERMHGLSKHFHAIRCSHPLRVYFGAWATLLLIIPFFALLTIPAMLLTGDIDSGKPLYYGIGFALLVLPWLMIARRAECGVCHIPLYRFGNYPHNRDAHYLPLLGYTFTTALHIIFLFWFRCPACGTMLKINTQGHRHHHH